MPAQILFISSTPTHSSKMSLSLRSTPDGQALSGRRSPNQIDPVPDLKYALSNFGAILTDDERKKLQAQKTGLNDADAAFKFTLKLDELDPVQRGRVTATRLCSLLQTVQSFGQVVETYVSSNPEIAALIWGTVKLTFMVRTLSHNRGGCPDFEGLNQFHFLFSTLYGPFIWI